MNIVKQIHGPFRCFCNSTTSSQPSAYLSSSPLNEPTSTPTACLNDKSVAKVRKSTETNIFICRSLDPNHLEHQNYSVLDDLIKAVQQHDKCGEVSWSSLDPFHEEIGNHGYINLQENKYVYYLVLAGVPSTSNLVGVYVFENFTDMTTECTSNIYSALHEGNKVVLESKDLTDCSSTKAQSFIGTQLRKVGNDLSSDMVSTSITFHNLVEHDMVIRYIRAASNLTIGQGIKQKIHEHDLNVPSHQCHDILNEIESPRLCYQNSGSRRRSDLVSNELVVKVRRVSNTKSYVPVHPYSEKAVKEYDSPLNETTLLRIAHYCISPHDADQSLYQFYNAMSEFEGSEHNYWDEACLRELKQLSQQDEVMAECISLLHSMT